MACAPQQFNGLTRLSDDACDIGARIKRSAGPGNYQVVDDRTTPFARANAVAMCNVTTTVASGYGNAPAAKIDDESILKNYTVQTHNRGTSRVQQRPFKSVPFMGRGRGDADTESVLVHAEQTHTARESGDVTEVQFPVFSPLIPQMAANVQKLSNIVEESASPGFTRTGIPSRSYARDNCKWDAALH